MTDLLINGDCLEQLKLMEADTLDSLVTDPPGGISFMSKNWDSGKDFVGRMTKIFEECLRVLKPGAHGLVWALPRTSHWTATALEQAGFEIRDVICHHFGTGFPKSLDISKAIDKAAGVEREVVGENPYNKIRGKSGNNGTLKPPQDESFITAPSTESAKQWQGFGTALKPASEHWILVRKPISEKTIAANVLKWGVGGINIDDCRIDGIPDSFPKPGNYPNSTKIYPRTSDKRESEPNQLGRFPANVVFSHHEDCYDNECHPDCAVKLIDEQSGNCKSGGTGGGGKTFHGSEYRKPEIKMPASNGGASRFFYCSKASQKDRNSGCEDMPIKQTTGGGGLNSISHAFGSIKAPAQNFHPTVKNTKLMEYLIKLVTPPGAIVLDPFMGSGSTGVAAKRLGFKFIGIEKEQEYFEIAEKRITSINGDT